MTTFHIPAENMPSLEARLAKLNKKADKINCPPVRMNVIHSFFKQYNSEYHEYVEVEVTGQAPIINGWHLVGQLTHEDGVVLLRTLPNETIPTQYHNADPGNCDHCNKFRRRNNTFVVRDKNNTYMQVGKTCLKDFTGHNDPQALAGYATHLHDFFDSVDKDYTRPGSYGTASIHFALEEFLARTVQVINKYGWVSRSEANFPHALERKIATADRVLEHYDAFEVTKEEEDFADVVIDWVKNQADNNDYTNNLKQIADVGFVTVKTSGYAASMVSSYQRYVEKANRLTVGENSVHIGNIKDRLELNVTVLSIKFSEGYYGRVEIHRFLDDNGNILVWFANAHSSMSEGQSYKVKATVKKHDEFNNTKQTIVNRVVILEENENAKA